MDAATAGTDLEHVLLSREQVATRIAELAAELDRDYADKDVLLVGVLKGAAMVMADLSRASGLSFSTIRRLEGGGEALVPSSRHRAIAALRAAGILFSLVEGSTIVVGKPGAA